MQKKIGTVLDDKLLSRAKAYCHKKHKTISRLLNDALHEYLKKQDASTPVGFSSVKSSSGAFKVPKETLKRILEEDIYET